jgi:hypothetical protein
MTDTERPEPTEPVRGWDSWRREWPTESKIAYLDAELTRSQLVTRLLTSNRVRPLLDDLDVDPWRERDTSARLTKTELAAVLLALSTPRDPIP